MTVPGTWEVEFHDFLNPLDLGLDPHMERFGNLVARARQNSARHGTPVLIGPDGRSDARVQLFFRTGPMASARPLTWRRYAFALKVWLMFLDAVGTTWDAATVADMDAFKDWRLNDVRNLERVAPSTFDTDRAALNTFYTWASARYGVFNPIAPVARSGSMTTGEKRAGRDPGRPAGARRRQVKWVLRPAFEQWRDVGLRGYGFDGLRVQSWRGWNEDRDAAFVDGLYGTGLRLGEWASILDIEVPAGGVGRFPRTWLSAACVKGAKEGRKYFVPSTVLSTIAAYTDPLSGSRAESIARAQRAGRYEQVPGRRIVTGYNRRSRVLHVLDPSGSKPVSVDVLGPAERRLLFRKGENGLEPLSLWLSWDGMPRLAHSWEDTFAAANGRIQRAWSEAGGEGEAALWLRPHMCRHSFALKWFSILSLVWEPRIEGLSAEERKDLRDQIGDVWFQLATLLGHADPATTRDYYLEPFNSLQMDYLMSLLDGEETAAVDAMVTTMARAGGRTLAPITPGEASEVSQ
ncbi:site-specific integrase [Nocardiopsis exhalans]